MSTNKWHAYEYLKQVYMHSGTIPSLQEAKKDFPDMPVDELFEGFREFALTIGLDIFQEGRVVDYVAING